MAHAHPAIMLNRAIFLVFSMFCRERGEYPMVASSDQSPAAYGLYIGPWIMHSLRLPLLAILLGIASSPSSAQFLFFQNPVTLDNLDGNYRTLAACAYQHLTRRLTGLSTTEPQKGVIKIASSSEQWELSFVNDERGRQTQLVWTAGGYPREFVLSTIRACAA